MQTLSKSSSTKTNKDLIIKNECVKNSLNCFDYKNKPTVPRFCLYLKGTSHLINHAYISIRIFRIVIYVLIEVKDLIVCTIKNT